MLSNGYYRNTNAHLEAPLAPKPVQTKSLKAEHGTIKTDLFLTKHYRNSLCHTNANVQSSASKGKSVLTPSPFYSLNRRITSSSCQWMGSKDALSYPPLSGHSKTSCTNITESKEYLRKKNNRSRESIEDDSDDQEEKSAEEKHGRFRQKRKQQQEEKKDVMQNCDSNSSKIKNGDDHITGIYAVGIDTGNRSKQLKIVQHNRTRKLQNIHRKTIYGDGEYESEVTKDEGKQDCFIIKDFNHPGEGQNEVRNNNNKALTPNRQEERNFKDSRKNLFLHRPQKMNILTKREEIIADKREQLSNNKMCCAK